MPIDYYYVQDDEQECDTCLSPQNPAFDPADPEREIPGVTPPLGNPVPLSPSQAAMATGETVTAPVTSSTTTYQYHEAVTVVDPPQSVGTGAVQAVPTSVVPESTTTATTTTTTTMAAAGVLPQPIDQPQMVVVDPQQQQFQQGPTSKTVIHPKNGGPPTIITSEGVPLETQQTSYTQPNPYSYNNPGQTTASTTGAGTTTVYPPPTTPSSARNYSTGERAPPPGSPAGAQIGYQFRRLGRDIVDEFKKFGS